MELNACFLRIFYHKFFITDVPDAPDAPTITDVTDNSMKVSWKPPTNDGGSPVIEYFLEHKISSEFRWSPVTISSTLNTEQEVKLLKKGKEYHFRVAAANKAGTGKWSKPSEDIVCKAPIVGEPPVIVTPMEDFMSVMPESAEFFCDVNLGSPSAEISWVKDNKEVLGNRFMTEYKDKSALLTVKDTQLSDSGTYQVIFENTLGKVQSQCTLTVHQPPKFTMDASVKKELTVKSNSSVTIEGDFVGVPEPTVEWFYGEKLVDLSNVKASNTPGSTRITVRNITAEQAGTYMCKITNSVGSDSVQYDVTVLEVPSAPQGLKVTSINKESISVEWSKPKSDGGSAITAYTVERQDMKRSTWVTAGSCSDEKLSFTVKKLVEGNEYNIRVSAENDIGVGPSTELDKPITAKNQFTVPSPPINLSVGNVTATTADLTWTKPTSDGGSPIIGYMIERKSQLAVRWTKVNKETVAVTNMQLRDLTESTTYEFRAYAVNDAGASEPSEIAGPITAKVPVIPAKFVKDLQDVSVKEDMVGTFECVIDKKGLEPIWKKNGMIINSSPKFSMESAGTKHTLTIMDCQTNDEAAYEVSFDGSVSQAGLQVEKDPLEIIKDLDSVTLIEMPKDVLFKCEVSKPGLSVKWLCNGRAVEESHKYKISSSGNIYQLSILSATEKDEGEYTILIKGLTSSAKLSAQVKPVLKLDKKYEDTIYLHAGKATIFEVPFQGYPKPEVVWMLDGKDLPRNRRLEVETTAALTCLRLKQAERGDTGNYSVTIKNEVGGVSATIALVVLDKPEPPQNLEANSSNETTVNLSWKAPKDDGGSPITHYLVEKREANKRSWTQAGKIMKELNFSVTNLSEGQNYVFQVKAVNKINESEAAELSGPVSPVSQHGKPSFQISHLSLLPEKLVNFTIDTIIFISYSNIQFINSMISCMV